MGSLNKVMVIGRIGQEPEKKVTQGGSTVVSISVATSESYNNKNGERQERTEWHRLVLWNKMADLATQYLRKGSQAYFEGRLQTRSWEDQNGNKRYTTEIVVSQMQFLDSGRAQEASAGAYQQNDNVTSPSHTNVPQQQSTKSLQPPSINDDFIEDDIPF